MVGNDPIMTRLFIGTLKGAAFDWFRSLPPNSINTWADLENLFLSRFYEDDTEVTMGNLLDTKQGPQEAIKDYIERF
ncbi:retrotransposon gag domain-containing protein, partial [Alteromonas stellipolaris]